MAYLLTHLIEEAADRDADQPAMVCRGDELSYGDLVNRARSLAHSLIEMGVDPGDRVGILMNKSVETAVALYGIMMAGAAYVPIDPTSPPARVAFVVNDCDIDIVISHDRHVGLLENSIADGAEFRHVIGIDPAPNSLRGTRWGDLPGDTSPVPERVTELDLSYILYTSGSTGVPKGIMHSHRSALAWAEVTASTYDIGPGDRITNYAPIHFDLSTLDFYGGARGRATTVMVPEEHMKLPASLANLLESERITLFYTVPMAIVQLAQPGILDGRDLTALGRVLFGGEPIPVKHLRRFSELVPRARLYNVYGPTEVNGVTHHEILHIGPDTHSIPIGAPYPNVEAAVVDEEDQPVSRGEIGELVIRAPTMMRGYWGRPDLNERAFLYRHRYAGLPEVFHRTGDLVSEEEGGLFEFHGRKDRQVKSRGYRVELDEVEAVLLQHPSVVEAAVYPVATEDSSTEICASAIVSADVATDESALLSFMARSLPPYAIPLRLSIETTFPRTTTGKIDRRELAAAASRDQGDS